MFSDRLSRNQGLTGLLFLAALLLRFFVLPWDAGTPPSPHPDERQVVSVAQHLESWNSDPGFFAYGSLHFQAVRFFGFLQGSSENWISLMSGGRMLSLLSSMFCLFIGWWLAAQAWGDRAALIFLLIGAWAPMDLQLSHYGTVEAHHSLWIMLVLLALFELGHRPTWGRALAAGLGFGASLAVKIASLGLLAPLGLLVMLFAIRGQSSLRILAGAQLFFGGALLAFYLGQPWAFAAGMLPGLLAGCVSVGILTALAALRIWKLRSVGFAFSLGFGLFALFALLEAFFSFPGRWAAELLRLHPNPQFLHDLQSQIAMVSGKIEWPYVRIYRHSTPLVYTLKQLLLWGVGPGVLLSFIWASCRAIPLLWRRRHRLLGIRPNDSLLLLLILLGWTLPNFLRLSTLQVKFLRYEVPLILPMALLGAWGLSRLRKGARRRGSVLAAASSMLWASAYAWALIQPHPFATATPWLECIIPDQAVVAWEHWDEHLPSIGGASLSLDSYDLPDTQAKMRKLAAVLADADWLILTSNRVRNTVLSNPDLYPLTGKLYRLLLSGRAGYDVLTQASRQPRILGWKGPVQGADESFLNYEFPRVLVLKRVEEIDPGRLAARCTGIDEDLKGLDSAALDRRLIAGTPEIPSRPGFRQQSSWTLLWLLCLGLGALSGWVLLLPTLRRWPDAGLGLSLLSFWVLPAWLLWLASEYLRLPVNSSSATAFFLMPPAAAGFVLLIGGQQKREEIRKQLRARRGAMLRVGAVFFGVFLLFLLIRAFNPAIFWGEKPMDFSFFNAFLNAGHWPPGEPWMAGQPLHYYYFGEILSVFLPLTLGIDSGVGYNLVCATIPALSAALLASLGLLFSRRKKTRDFLLLPLLVLLVGNLAWPWLLDLARAHRWFDLWWATSRVIPGYAIDEYPLWTAVFSDLHAHFIAGPLFLGLLAWAWVLLSEKKHLIPIIGCGLMAGVLAATNPWDIPMAAAFCGLTVLLISRRIPSDLGLLIAAAISGILLILPFANELLIWLRQGAGGAGPLLGFNTADFAPYWAELRHFGLFLLPLAAFAFIRPKKDIPIALLLAASGVGLGLSFSSPAAALGLGLGIFFLTALRWTGDLRQRIGWCLAATALFGIAFAERFTLIDRMNTIFKIYNGVWLGLALALGILLLRSDGLGKRLLLWTTTPLLAIAFINLPIGILQGWIQPRVASPRPSLDGRAFLEAHDPSDAYLVSALRGMARSGDVVAEAAGPSYQNFSRIAMHTGLPTIVGWEWHLRQRGQDPLRISARFDALRELYTDSSATRRRAILDRYGVDWIVCGDLERRHYQLRDKDPFAGIPGVSIMAQEGRSLLYRVRR